MARAGAPARAGQFALVLSAILALGAQARAEDSLSLASGPAAHLQERLIEEGEDGLVHRFRFVSEGFDPSAQAPETVMTDLQALCTHYAIPALSAADRRPDRIVISLADRAVEFGVMAAEARQVFEAFSIEDDVCIWEMY